MDTVDLGKDLQSLVKAGPSSQLKFAEQVPLKILHRVATEVILTTAFSSSGLSEGCVPGSEPVNGQDCGMGEGRNDGGGGCKTSRRGRMCWILLVTELKIWKENWKWS